MPKNPFSYLNGRLKHSSLGRFYKTNVEKELEGRHTRGTPYIAGSDTVTTGAIRLLPPTEGGEPIFDPATHSHLPHMPHGTAEIVGAAATGYLAGAGLISSLAVAAQAAQDERKLEAMLVSPALASQDRPLEAGAIKRYLRKGREDAQFEKIWGGAAPAVGSAANLTGIFVAPLATAGLGMITLTGAAQTVKSVQRAYQAHLDMKAAQRNVRLENQAAAETFFKEQRNEQIANAVTWSTFTAGAGILAAVSLGAQVAAIPLTGGAALPAVGVATVLAGAAATTITNNKLKGNKFSGYDINHLETSLLNADGKPLSEKEVDERLGQAGTTRSLIKNYRHEALKSRSFASKAEFTSLNLLRSGVSIATLGLIPQLSRSIKHKARDLAAKSIKPTHEIAEARLQTLTSIAAMQAPAASAQPSEEEETHPASYERIAEKAKAAQLDKAIVRRFAKQALRYDRSQQPDGSWTAQPRFSARFLKKANIEGSELTQQDADLLHKEAANTPPDPEHPTSRQEGYLLPDQLRAIEDAPATQKLITRAVDKELLFTQRNRARKNIAVYAKLASAFDEQHRRTEEVSNGR